MYILPLSQKIIRPYTDKSIAFMLAELQLFIMIFPFADLAAAVPIFKIFNTVANLLNAVLTALSFFYILHLNSVNFRLRDHYVLIVFVALMVISMGWVHPAMAADSKTFVIRTLITILRTFVIVQIFTERPGKFLDILKRFAIIITILSTLFILIYKEESNWFLKEPERHQSFFSSPNNLGQFIAFAFIMINFYKRKELSLPVLLFLDGLLFFEAHKCDSMTSQLGVIVCFAAYNFRFLLRPLFYVWIALGIAIPMYTHHNASTKAEQIEFANRDMTFTGRSDVWDIEFKDMDRLKKNTLGFGAGGYYGETLWHPKSTLDNLEWEPHQGHNGYLDIRVMMGIVGLVLLIIFLLEFIETLFVKKKILEDVTFFLPLIIIINNFTETSLFRTRHFYFVIFMGIYWYVKQKNILPAVHKKQSEAEPA
ncbi:hypothetical protein BH09BAC2_BH09BAC2_18140 [soil metagenome]